MFAKNVVSCALAIAIVIVCIDQGENSPRRRIFVRSFKWLLTRDYFDFHRLGHKMLEL